MLNLLNIKKSSHQILKSQAGLSIMEILIALTLIGLAGTFIVSRVLDNLEEGKQEAAKIQINNLKNRLLDYKRRCGQFPSSEQGLDALVQAPTAGEQCKRYPANGFIEGGRIPMDPWDNEYVYTSDGRNYGIISLGADGAEGGEGFDSDINSKEI